ncbi:MAG: cysteine--tRNA ligase [Thermoplasmata archaeon]|nr:cysteine--tRNA ligase [Thermoplasmata archaeon]
MMALEIFDSKTGTLREFRPADPEIVRMYVCGPTVYTDAHIGHARSYVSFDVMRRYLELRGHRVRMVINITDLDDVIDQKAARLGEKPEVLAARYGERFLEDLRTLNVRPSYANPRVSENVPAMIGIIEKLNEEGYVYEVDGNHYFRTTLLGGYGQLTHERPEDLLADEPIMEGRENPFDFLIWKKSKEGMVSWDSSLGAGRPGWHIQCYGIMRGVLGDSIDIHGGGEDLKFPHHESNILISLAHKGKDAIGYHVHNGFMTRGKEKMSKSLGNFVPLRDVFERFGGSVVRFYLLRSHYRETIDYDEDDIEKAQQDLDLILGFEKDLKEVEKDGKPRGFVEEEIARHRKTFMDSMDNDFDTPGAITALLDFAGCAKTSPDDLRTTEARLALGVLSEADSVLGLTGAD